MWGSLLNLYNGGGVDNRIKSASVENLHQLQRHLKRRVSILGDKRNSYEPIREENVQKAISFLSRPPITQSPELYIQFLETKGLNISEIQESINRLENLNADEQLNNNYDPVFILPPIKYEEFIYRINQPDSARINTALQRFVFVPQRKHKLTFGSFIKMFTTGLGTSYSIEDKGKMVQNQVNLITEEATHHFKRMKVKFTTSIIAECVEKFIMTKLFDVAFTPTEEDARLDRLLAAKIEGLNTFIEIKHLDIPPSFRDESLWSVAQEGMTFR
jgi:hypothetical protein